MKHVIPGLFLLILLANCSSKKAVAPSAGTIELATVGVAVPEGQLMIFNAPGAYYTFVVKGKNIRNTTSVHPGDPMALMVDGIFLQMTTLPISQFITTDFSRKADRDILQTHLKYESEYLGSLIQQDYKIDQEPLTLDNGRECLIWMMEVEGLPTQVLITTAVRPHILMLSTPLYDGGKMEEDQILGKLLGAVESVQQYREPVDPLKLQDSVVKAVAAARKASSGE
ncbi:MAG: hypothetical protein KDD67_01020 [Ignavibacteriae bacterium]|nr:hypothetical protein [Ignavibacteriota bacterium]MCB9217697.1 hypothetical protein [Ignavibacteria bacterium]